MKLRHLPNAISFARLATVPILLWLTWAGRQDIFAWLLLVAGLSDILDGWLARHFGWTSRLGAMLDSIADVALTLAAIIGLWAFHRTTLAAHWPVIAAVCLTWLVVHVTALLRYGKLASFHTRLTQVGLFGFGLFVLSIFFYQFIDWLFFAVAGLCALAGLENLIMIALLKKWTPNRRGGLLALLQERSGQKTVP